MTLLLGTEKKSCNLSRPKKITQPLGTKKITQPLEKKKSRNLLRHKNFLKTQILVTIKIQEISTDHLGLVFRSYGTRGAHLIFGHQKGKKQNFPNTPQMAIF